MDNLDLFTDVNIPTTSVGVMTTQVDDTPPPAPKKPKARKNDTPSVMPNILLFATQYQKSMWTAWKHRRDCMMQVTKFASFRDYGMKPMHQITAQDIIEYRDCLVEQGELTNGTINRHLSAVSASFQFAVEDLRLMEDRPRSCLLK